MSKWEMFRHDRAIGVRMPSDNKTKYGAVRYVTIGGFDREDPEQMAEVERIVHMIADAPALLKALADLLALAEQMEVSLDSNYDCRSLDEIESSGELADEIIQARALIAKHGGGV